MSDGFSPENDKLTQETLAPAGGGIMDSKADGFAPMITTTDVKAGFNNIETVTLAASDGTAILAEHHQLGVLNVTKPGQDVPPGETKAQP